jgi:hypothetical protein
MASLHVSLLIIVRVFHLPLPPTDSQILLFMVLSDCL